MQNLTNNCNKFLKCSIGKNDHIVRKPVLLSCGGSCCAECCNSSLLSQYKCNFCGVKHSVENDKNFNPMIELVIEKMSNELIVNMRERLAFLLECLTGKF
jgi:hypothetical protein